MASTLNRRSIDNGPWEEHDQTSHGAQAAVRKFTRTHTHRCMITDSRAILTGLGHAPCLPRVHAL